VVYITSNFDWNDIAAPRLHDIDKEQEELHRSGALIHDLRPSRMKIR